MKRFLLSLTLLVSITAFSSSCKDDEDTSATVETVDANLVWTGDYAVDGCGYMLRIGNVEHKPVNEAAISAQYKESSPTKVETKIINYHKTQRYCMAGAEINTIKILELRKR